MIPSGGARRLSSSHTGRRNARSDWWLAQGQSLVPFVCFVSHTVLGTKLIIFVDCPSLLLLPTYIGLCLNQLVDGPALGHQDVPGFASTSSSKQAPGSAFILLLPSYSLLAFSLADAPSLPGTGSTPEVLDVGHHPVRVISKRGWMGFYQLILVSLGVIRGDPQ